MNNKVTIVIPAYNNEKHISYAIESALSQDYPCDVIVVDDCSTDKTFEIASKYKVKIYINQKNMGIGYTLERCMKVADGRFVIYLCADDIFTCPQVVGDMVKELKNPEVGIVGRFYYYFMDGFDGAIGTCRDRNILTSSCCPSGMGFKKSDVSVSSKIFVEMPSIVKQYILDGWKWTMIPYDTVAARYCPGVNTGTKSSYYTESPTQNWIDLLDQNYQDFPIFITLKNRQPRLLWSEICLHVRNDKRVLLNVRFWAYALTALILPSSILRRLSRFLRHRIGRLTAKIIRRDDV